jgi:DNA-binding response OmpR family regulator
MIPTRVLVIEDEVDLREELVDYLIARGYRAHGVASLAAMHAALQTDDGWQVLVLDLRLPDGDGFEGAQAVRLKHGLKVGIIMATARSMVDDRIRGLSDGADAYLVKPVDPRELCAQIDRVALRLQKASQQEVAGWRLDVNELALHCPGNARVSLTGSEAILLARLLANPGRTVDRALLCQALGQGDTLEAARRLDTLVSRLRAKVRQHSPEELPVRSFRNQGYAFTGNVR